MTRKTTRKAKPARNLKSLPVKKLSAQHAGGVRGGATNTTTTKTTKSHDYLVFTIKEV